MINISILTEEDKRRKVIYCSHGKVEEGYITSWNVEYIFVDYGKNCGRGTATSPKDLEFI